MRHADPTDCAAFRPVRFALRARACALAFVILLPGCLFPIAARAQNDAAQAEIAAAEAAVGKAFPSRDFAALEKLWSPRMLVNSPGNTILTRDDVFAAIRRGHLNYARYENKVESFRQYGEVAVVMGREEIVPDFGPEKGKTFLRRYTDVWQKSEGAWVQIARQATYTSPSDIYADSK